MSAIAASQFSQRVADFYNNYIPVTFAQIKQYDKTAIVFFCITSVTIIGLTVYAVYLGFEDVQMQKYSTNNGNDIVQWIIVASLGLAVLFLIVITLLYRYIYLPGHIKKLQLAAQDRLNDRRTANLYNLQGLEEAQEMKEFKSSQ